MNTGLNKLEINPEFASLFSFKDETERREHNAAMISYRILGEIEKICEKREINKKQLADLVGTSRSYITQLFTGAKAINTLMMARFEDALEFNFEFSAKLNAELLPTMNPSLIKRLHALPAGCNWDLYSRHTDFESDIIGDINLDKKKKEAA